MYSLAHLSDPHLADWRVAGPRELASKRVLGFLSWQLRRRRIHRSEVLALLMEDLRASNPDHIAVTGDITNISLPAEFDAAARWLARLGPPEKVTVVPGNHDAYIALPWERSLARWSGYMAGDDAAPSSPVAVAEFPFLRRRGPLAIIGLSTAAPMPYNSAGGILGAAQLQRLEACLTRLASESLCRVVLIHHPPQASATTARKSLGDAEAFRAVIRRGGADLILHGHTHRAHLDRLETPNGHAAVVGVPSASALPHNGKPAARFHLFRVERAGDGWRIELEVRALAPGLDGFRSETRFVLGPVSRRAA